MYPFNKICLATKGDTSASLARQDQAKKKEEKEEKQGKQGKGKNSYPGPISRSAEIEARFNRDSRGLDFKRFFSKKINLKLESPLTK